MVLWFRGMVESALICRVFLGGILNQRLQNGRVRHRRVFYDAPQRRGACFKFDVSVR